MQFRDRVLRNFLISYVAAIKGRCPRVALAREGFLSADCWRTLNMALKEREEGVCDPNGKRKRQYPDNRDIFAR